MYRKLSRLDGVLADMAQRAARFYLMLGDLARTNDTRPEVFLAHKDALLTHMREFHSELSRYSPLLADAVAEVDAVGADRIAALAAEADERLFRAPAERVADWRHRWGGLVQWFGASARSEAERLQDATITGIANVTALLRRVTESRRGGVSRESQLRHLAQWFANAPADADAHALFQAVFGLGAPRHVSAGYDDPDLIPARLSWWEAEPVTLARTLVRTGRAQSLHGPGQDPAQRGREAAAARRAAQGDRAAARGRRAAGERRRVRAGTRRAGDPGAARPAGRGAGGAGPGQPDGHRDARARWRPGRRTGSGSPCARRSAPRPCTPSGAGSTSTASGWR